MPKTKDVYPNYLTSNVVQTADNAIATEQIFMPIPRVQGQAKKATVMEFLWVDYAAHGVSLNGVGEELTFSLTTQKPSTAIAVLRADAPGVLMFSQMLFSVLTSGASLLKWPQTHNFQTADGHGLLVATDSIQANIDTAAQAGGTRAEIDFRIFYRFVDIDVMEYVGIVQSQQAT